MVANGVVRCDRQLLQKTGEMDSAIAVDEQLAIITTRGLSFFFSG